MNESTDIRVTALTLAAQFFVGQDADAVLIGAQKFLQFLAAPPPTIKIFPGDRMPRGPARDAEIVRMIGDGLKTSDIAEKLGISKITLKVEKRRLGLTRPTEERLRSLAHLRAVRAARRAANGASAS